MMVPATHSLYFNFGVNETKQTTMANNSSDQSTSTNLVSNWLHYYFSLSQSLLNPEMVEAATEEEPPCARQVRRRPSSVRFMESVSVRHLEVQKDDSGDLYYSKQDIAAFHQEQEQEKERQARNDERKKAKAKRSIREQRRLKLAHRKSERTKELTCTCTSTAGAITTSADKHKDNNQTSIAPPHLLLGDFLAKSKTAISSVESAQDARDAFSVF
jgi:hypothetical protein